MNMFINALLIFIFIIVLITIKVLDISSNNLITNKIYFFCSIFLFQLLIQSIYTLKYTKLEQNINIKLLINNALTIAVFSIIGYSIYFDLLNINLIDANNKFNSLFMSLIITLFICVSYNIKKIL
jgi:hypothetical protein